MSSDLKAQLHYTDFTTGSSGQGQTYPDVVLKDNVHLPALKLANNWYILMITGEASRQAYSRHT